MGVSAWSVLGCPLVINKTKCFLQIPMPGKFFRSFRGETIQSKIGVAQSDHLLLVRRNISDSDEPPVPGHGGCV